MVTSPNPPGSPGKDKVPWPLLIVFVLVAVIIAIVTVLPRGRKTTNAPIQLSQFEIVPAPAGGRPGGIYVDALLHNAGTTAIAEVEVSATFVGNNGTLKTINGLLVENMAGTGHSHDLVNDRIKPNESRRVSIYVAEPPTGWNHQPPQITVKKVSATVPP